jgi:membrane protease YdiL (CAAX protease family)
MSKYLLDNTEQNNNNVEPVNAPLANMHPAVFVLLALFIVFVTYQIFGGVLSVLVLGTDFKKMEGDVTFARVIISFSQFMFILVPVIILSMLQGNKAKKTFRLNFPKQSVLWLSILGVLVIQPTIQAYMFVQNKMLTSLPFGSQFINSLKELMDSLEAATLSLVTAHNAGEFVLVAFVIALTPAVCEEFLFRGLVLTNFERTMNPGKAILMTGFIFAVFHFHPFNLIPLILLGFFLSFTVFYSDSILTGIVVHFVNNFLSAFLVYKYGKEGFDDTRGSFADNYGLLLSGFVSFIIFLFILKAIKNITTEKKNKIIVNV